MILPQLTTSPDMPSVSRGIKGGVKLEFEMLTAYTEDRFLVPLEHPEAVVFAGITMQRHVGDDPAYADDYNTYHMQQFLDNSAGQDGDKPGIFDYSIRGFYVDGLTQPLELGLQDRGQIIYASGNRTFHKTPGKGRFPIGVYLMTAQSKDYTGKVSTELFHWIDTSVNLPRYKA